MALPLLIGPPPSVDPLPSLADTEIKFTIESPVPLGLFNNSKPSSGAFWAELIRGTHFKISGYDRLCGHRNYFFDSAGTAIIAVGLSCSGSLMLPLGWKCPTYEFARL